MKKLLVKCLLFVLAGSAGFLFLFSQNAPSPGLAPVNPEFLKVQDDIRNGKFTQSQPGLGRMPSPVDLSYYVGVHDGIVQAGYPASFDLRTLNKVTSVKNQASCGDCWAFGAMGSLESSLLPGESRDFAEIDLARNHGFDWTECAGGNTNLSQAYLSRWAGPYNETDYPYPYSAQASPQVQKHIQKVLWVPARASSTDNDTIKWFLTNYGAVTFAFYWVDANYSATNKTYIYPTAHSSDHEICIVGWDDNFDKSKFVSPPAGNGAFLCKNSWGTGWGDAGYFWLSYYDATITDMAVFVEAKSPTNYKAIYQYDPLGWETSFGYSTTICWGANVFTASTSDPLDAIGFIVNDNSTVAYSIYKNPTAGNPASGTLLGSGNAGTYSYVGFYTFKLPSSVPLAAGDKFSVVLKFTNSTYKYPLALEGYYSGYTSAAANAAGQSFYSSDGLSWTDFTAYNSNSYRFNCTIKAYTGAAIGEIKLSRTSMSFGCVTGKATCSQEVVVSNAGQGTLSWTAAPSASWITVLPTSGTGSGTVSIGVNTTGLTTGTYSGTVLFSDPQAGNSPQAVSIALKFYAGAVATPPFGSFDTPVGGSTVTSSVPVTGWALDDLEVQNVKIYRDPVSGETGGPNGLVYVGDATFVEGARPDIETAYPAYPLNFRSGWGYMLLTNFLPSSGNGSFVLHANATDIEGHEISLGTKMITCDNLHAVKPFGAIDTPAQGGSVSGSTYVNFGWVLTPLPNTVPKDGSTISAWVDGAQVGALNSAPNAYNQYRADIATLFPGLNNSGGAVGFAYLNTTLFTNGVHSIYWIATDNAGHADGIGSRYFNVLNTGGAAPPGLQVEPVTGLGVPGSYATLMNLPVSFEPRRIKTGFDLSAKPAALKPDNYGILHVGIREVERLELDLQPISAQGRAVPGISTYSGYLVVGERLRPLPIGSTLDLRKGLFTWLPGPGFLGTYELVFVRRDQNGGESRIRVAVKIIPKFSRK